MTDESVIKITCVGKLLLGGGLCIENLKCY